MDKNESMQIAALKIVTIISESSHLDALFQFKILENVSELLKNSSFRVIQMTLKLFLVLISVPNRSVTKRVISLNLIPDLLRWIRANNHKSAILSLQVVRSLLNDGYWLLSDHLLGNGVIGVLLGVCREKHYTEVEVALDVMRMLLEISVEMSLELGENRVLEELGEWEADKDLDRMYMSANEEIARKAGVILERYFGGDEEEVEGGEYEGQFYF